MSINQSESSGRKKTNVNNASMTSKADGQGYCFTLSYYHQKCGEERIRIFIPLVCPKCEYFQLPHISAFYFGFYFIYITMK